GAYNSGGTNDKVTLTSIAQDRLGSRNGKFYPYGQERPSATANDKEKFTGYYRDASTGLDYADQRYHQAGVGRFMTPDPFGGSAKASDPGSWNRYAYVGGDSVNRVDGTGLSCENPEKDTDSGCGAPCYGVVCNYSPANTGSALDFLMAFIGIDNSRYNLPDFVPNAPPIPAVSTCTICTAQITTSVSYSLKDGVPEIAPPDFDVPIDEQWQTLIPQIVQNNPQGFINAFAVSAAAGGVFVGAPLPGVAAGGLTTLGGIATGPYPPNGGFFGSPAATILQSGTLIERLGTNYGTYASPVGTPSQSLSLIPGTSSAPYNIFVVTDSIPVLSGPAMPWYGQPGMGTQYVLPSTVDDLIESGSLVNVIS
ncbi:MAG: glycohydrolase toxin TNT-related protein, partial [Bryobacteraceae bacterium]